jgi:hypothetical protein
MLNGARKNHSNLVLNIVTYLWDTTLVEGEGTGVSNGIADRFFDKENKGVTKKIRANPQILRNALSLVFF